MSDSVLAWLRVEEALQSESVIGETGEIGGDTGDTGMRGTSNRVGVKVVSQFGSPARVWAPRVVSVSISVRGVWGCHGRAVMDAALTVKRLKCLSLCRAGE